uniref:Ig-like domain-containing protein n=1 Tax=Xenopsylla cheopis TaxID=163159 RepID=A0A6M2DWB4_XENCH
MILKVCTILLLICGISAVALEEEIRKPIVKEAKYGSTVTIRTSIDNWDYNLLRCTIKLPPHLDPAEKELEFKPNVDENLPKNVRPEFFSSDCSIEISDASEKEYGNWTMRSYYAKRNDVYKNITNPVIKQEFSLILVKEVESVPAQELTIPENSDLFLRLKDPVPNMTACQIKTPQEETITIWDSKGKDKIITTPEKPQFEFWENEDNSQCGVIVRQITNETGSGKWGIEAVDQNSILHRSTIQVNVDLADKKEDDYPVKRILTLGINEIIDLAPKGSMWCRARPVESPVNGYCVAKFIPVKKTDNKKWIVSWFSSISNEMIQKEVEFIVREPRYIETSVKEIKIKESKSYNLMCRLKSENIQHCIFERPDGKVFNMKPGIGSGRYSYHGNGYSTSSYHETDNECGMTIKDVQKEDFGIWKCYLNDPNSKQKSDVSFLTVGEEVAIEEIPRTKNKIIETHTSANLTITCGIRSSLDYCLIQHPNGTTTFEPNESTSFDIYDLRSGLCGVQVTNLTIRDEGEWSCRMGVKDAAEAATKYMVKVYDKKIISQKNENVKENNTASISCRIINNVTLSYCKFTRHDGFSIHSKNILNEKYEFSGNLDKGLCILNIFDVDSKHDIGEWICSASLVDNSEELSTKIQLLSHDAAESNLSTAGTQIILITVFSIGLVVATMFLIFYKYKNRIRRNISSRYSQNSIPKPEDPIPFYLAADSPLSKA